MMGQDMTRGKALTPIELHLIKVLSAEGKGPSAIGRQMAMNRQTVHRAIVRLKDRGEWDNVRRVTGK